MLLIFAVLSLYYIGAVFFLYTGLRFLKRSPDRFGNRFSVIIAARNEEQHIASCLESIFAQTIDADRYEVIVIDDRSTDGTGRILGQYAAKNPRCTVVTLTETDPGYSPKKYALTQGIKHARNEVIVLTDADCIVPPSWLDTIDRYCSPQVGLVQGITVYYHPKGMNSLLYGFQAIDFLSHGVIAAASIGRGLPINSNANNFAFHKDLYNSLEGFSSVTDIVSGDDDLLMQKIWRSKKQVVFMPECEGAVSTAPSVTLKAILEQRKRWGSKTIYYALPQRLFLSGIFLFYCMIPVSLFGSFLKSSYLIFFLLLIVIKLLGESILLIPGTRLFCQNNLRKYIVIGSLLQLPMVLFAVFGGVFDRFEWKGRRYARKIHP